MDRFHPHLTAAPSTQEPPSSPLPSNPWRKKSWKLLGIKRGQRFWRLAKKEKQFWGWNACKACIGIKKCREEVKLISARTCSLYISGPAWWPFGQPAYQRLRLMWGMNNCAKPCQRFHLDTLEFAVDVMLDCWWRGIDLGRITKLLEDFVLQCHVWDDIRFPGIIFHIALGLAKLTYSSLYSNQSAPNFPFFMFRPAYHCEIWPNYIHQIITIIHQPGKFWNK